MLSYPRMGNLKDRDMILLHFNALAGWITEYIFHYPAERVTAARVRVVLKRQPQPQTKKPSSFPDGLHRCRPKLQRKSRCCKATLRWSLQQGHEHVVRDTAVQFFPIGLIAALSHRNANVEISGLRYKEMVVVV